MEKIIKQLKEAMVRKNISRYKIRKEVGLSHDQVKNLLSVKGSISLRVVISACRVLGIKNLKID